MSTTVVAWGDPKAQKRWGSDLFVDTIENSYWTQKLMGQDDNNIIQERMELESDSGDRISFDLSVELLQEPTEGDATLDGKEEHLRFFTDEVAIDQTRKAVSAGGRMSRKRTVHDLRMTAKRKLRDYWAKYFDEMYFIYLSGARGINEAFKVRTTFAGRANNALQAPDANHILYGGSATSKGSVVTSDKMTRAVIERANVKASMMHARDPQSASMVPVTIQGSKRFLVIMSPFQKYDLRTADTNGWLQLQRDAAGAEGSNNRLFRGGLGMIDNTVLHEHENVIRFNDYGVGNNVVAARALFLARQAGVLAFGSTDGKRGIWVEEMSDYKNNPKVAGGFIFGFKKTRFANRDFGVIAIDTAAADPNG